MLLENSKYYGYKGDALVHLIINEYYCSAKRAIKKMKRKLKRGK